MVKILEHAKFAMNRELKSKFVNGGLNYSVTLNSKSLIFLPTFDVREENGSLFTTNGGDQNLQKRNTCEKQQSSFPLQFQC